jgi:uncharacterized protein YciI
MFNLHRLVAALFAFQVFALPATSASAQTPAATRHYIYVLRLVPRLHDPKNWTERDNLAVSEHFKRLQQATAQGKVLLAGRTDEPPDKTFGIVVFEAADDAAAREFMETDPTLVAGVMSATVHPYSVALLRR